MYYIHHGWGYVQTGTKVKHKYQLVKSLDKCKTYEDIPDRFKNKKVALSPKLDGLTGVFYYERGKLVRAITRGNGTEGKDITDKARIIVGNEIMDKHFTGAVRGELEISKANWEIVKDRYPDAKNARNLCAGWINSKEYKEEEIKLIDFVTYKITGQEREPDRQNIFYNFLDNKEISEACLNYDPLKFDIITWLDYNFEHVIPKVEATLTGNNFMQFMERVFADFQEEGYVLDGIVISDMETKYDAKSYSYLYDECAFKFEAESTETIIKDIEWTLSRTKRMVPVAMVEPVFLSGATVERATCNNAKQVKEWGLGKGAEIKIQRANEVIPYIMEVINISDQELPDICPACGHKLEWVGVDLKCVNDSCSGADLLDLQRWCELIGETDGFAWLLMKQYLDIFEIKSIADLYSKEPNVNNYFATRTLSITDTKAREFFNKLYKDPVDIERALIALNIPRLGDKTARLLAKDEKLVKELLENAKQFNVLNDTTLFRDLLNVVKDATTNSISSSLDKIKNLSYIEDRIKYKENTNQEVIKVAVTGSLETMKRSVFEKYIESYGYELSSAIKSCKYLITNNPNSGSSKNKDAQKYGVEIITERDFLSLLGGQQETKQTNTLF